MIKTECIKCNDWIIVKLPAEATETKCPNCGGLTPVKDLYVSAGPYTIFRDTLKKNAFKYKRLVKETENEVAEFRKTGSDKKDLISFRSISAFLSDLKELLEGCRDNSRQKVGGINVKFRAEGKVYEGKVVNISLTGMCLDASRISRVNKLWSELEVFVNDDGMVPIKAKIMWVGNGDSVGLMFTDMDDEKRDLLNRYIKEKSFCC